MGELNHPRPRALAGLGLVLLVILSMTVPSAAAAERPKNWTCDESGQLVCAGADAGGNVDCVLDRTGSDSAEAQCAWTYGQLMGGASPLGLPGEASFTWSATVTICLTHADLQPISCEPFSTSGQATCSWLVLQECIESQGPNPGESALWSISTGQCLLVEVVSSGTAQAWTLSQDEELAHAEHAATGTNAGSACLQNDGRP